MTGWEVKDEGLTPGEKSFSGFLEGEASDGDRPMGMLRFLNAIDLVQIARDKLEIFLVKFGQIPRLLCPDINQTRVIMVALANHFMSQLQ